MIYAKNDMVIITDYGVERINKNEMIDDKYFIEIIDLNNFIEGGNLCHTQQKVNISHSDWRPREE